MRHSHKHRRVSPGYTAIMLLTHLLIVVGIALYGLALLFHMVKP